MASFGITIMEEMAIIHYSRDAFLMDGRIKIRNFQARYSEIDNF